MTPGKALVGTAEYCELRVRDEYASPEHCLIERTDAGLLFVTDVGSTNGTWIELRGDMMAELASMLAGTGRNVRVGLRDRVSGRRRWMPGWTLWVGRSGLDLDTRGWVRAVKR